MLEVMQELNSWIDEIPPLVQPSRFGNKAFRIWFDRLCSVSCLAMLLYRTLFPLCNRLWVWKTWKVVRN